jgi:arylsulfatase A-like enzyme
VLVTVDTLRADAVSFNGYTKPTTPFLDSLALEGVSFSRAYAASSWTPPSMASLFTGVAPASHGITFGDMAVMSPVGLPILSESFRTLAETLRSAGYVTVGISSNLHLLRELGFAQGFDLYSNPTSFVTAAVVNSQARCQLKTWFGEGWRSAWKHKPLFLWLHYFDPHDPYLPYKRWMDRYAPGHGVGKDSPANLAMRSLKDRFPVPNAALAAEIRPIYDSEVARVDEHIRQVWVELGLDEDVLFILTSDHGEEIVDHGALGHSQSLYEELVRVPLLIRWPRRLARGLKLDRPVQAVDLYPTLVELLGLDRPAGLQGQSLAPWLLGQAGPPEARPVFCQLSPPKPHLTAVCDGRWKLIRSEKDPAETELYDLEADPHERDNRAAQNPEVVRRLAAALQSWRKALPPAPQVQTFAMTDAEMLEQLKALDYLGP